MREKLTQARVTGAELVAAGRQEIHDSVVPGLSLRIGATTKAFYLRYRVKATGKQRNMKLGSILILSLNQARTTAQELLARVALGEDPAALVDRPEEGLSLREFLEERYFPWAHENLKSAREVERSIRVTFAPLLDRQVADLTVQDVEKVLSSCRKKGNKNITLNRKTVHLKAALNWGVKHAFLESNPLARLSRKQETDSTPKLRYLSQEEEQRLMAALAHAPDYLRVMVVISLKTGIRRGALFSLEWRDIDFTHRTLHVRGEICKTGKGRIIPLSESTLQVLRNWGPGEGLIFPSPRTGGRFDNVKSAWERVLRDAAVENFRWHDLRHTFASRLVMAGVDLNVVRELMGHSDLKMTLRYAHLAPEAKSRAVELLG